MNALVMGGNGFIGSHLLDYLLNDGHSVRVFDQLPERYRPPLTNIDYHVGHFGNAFSMAEALYDIDVVFHLVSTTLPATSNLEPIMDIKDNLVATVVLLEQMIKAGINKIIFLSSGGTVYGQPRSIPVTEDHPLNPICSYGIVKVAIENYLFMFQQLYNLNPIIIRPSNPYGPRQGHLGVQGLISTFLHKLIKNEPLIVWGDGTIMRDYIYISDLAKLIMLAGKSDVTGVFNAGFGAGFSVNEIIRVITDVIGNSCPVHYEPARSFDVKEIHLDIEKSKETFGWVPEISLKEGISMYWDWLNEKNTLL